MCLHKILASKYLLVYLFAVSFSLTGIRVYSKGGAFVKSITPIKSTERIGKVYCQTVRTYDHFFNCCTRVSKDYNFMIWNYSHQSFCYHSFGESALPTLTSLHRFLQYRRRSHLNWKKVLNQARRKKNHAANFLKNSSRSNPYFCFVKLFMQIVFDPLFLRVSTNVIITKKK